MAKGFITTDWDHSDKKSEDTLRLLNSWGKRINKFAHMFARKSAEHILEQLLEKIPKGPEYKEYRDSLRVSRVRGSKLPAWSVGVTRKQRRLREKDTETTQLLVKPKRGGITRNPAIAVLVKHNPWTMSTLPLKPEASDAVLISRKVTKKELQQVEEAKKASQAEWTRELSEIGIRVDLKATQKLLQGAKAVSDVGFDALRMEFGVKNTQAKAHWRPAMHEFRSHGLKRLMHWRSFKDVFTKVRYTGWRQWPGRAPTISMSEAKTYNKFAKRVLKRK